MLYWPDPSGALMAYTRVSDYLSSPKSGSEIGSGTVDTRYAQAEYIFPLFFSFDFFPCEISSSFSNFGGLRRWTFFVGERQSVGREGLWLEIRIDLLRLFLNSRGPLTFLYDPGPDPVASPFSCIKLPPLVAFFLSTMRYIQCGLIRSSLWLKLRCFPTRGSLKSLEFKLSFPFFSLPSMGLPFPQITLCFPHVAKRILLFSPRFSEMQLFFFFFEAIFKPISR